MTTTPRPRPRARRRAGESDTTPPPPLQLAVATALRALDDQRHLDRDDDRRLLALLRAAISGHRTTDGAAPTVDPRIAVRTACAYLAIGDREEAYLALRDAQDLLGGPPPVAG